MFPSSLFYFDFLSLNVYFLFLISFYSSIFSLSSSLLNQIRHPFLDPYSTMQRSDLPLTVHEYDEFGNPADPLISKYIHSYSPCENIKNHTYPAMFVSTGDMDQKAGPWESLKWVTRVREMQERRLLQFEQLSDLQSPPSSSGSCSESGTEKDSKIRDQESLNRIDSDYISCDSGTASTSILPDSFLDTFSPRTLPLIHSMEGEKEAIQEGEAKNKHSERLIVFSMSPNTGHDGASDPAQGMYLQAAEIVFLENAIKKNL